MNIIILFTNPFPYGDAAANRVISYTKGMAQLGHTVTVHCLQPSVRYSEKDNPDVLKPEVYGTIEGINYIHTSGTVYWPDSGKGLLKKQWLRWKSYINSAKRIFCERKSIDIVQIYSNNTAAFVFYHYILKLCGIKFISERSELPNTVKQKEHYQKNFINRFIARFVEKTYKYFDAWILETQTLADYYLPRGKKNAPCLLVPMTVEEERFIGVKKEESEYGRYIAYCGNMREDDGVSILIKSFCKIANKYPDIKLVLAGASSDTPKQKQLSEMLGISNRVLFIGRLNRDEIPSFITNADVLCLASPKSPRASASMPCKVGEYMCTGNPVVVTGQGEIFKYLKDGENAFLVEPDDIEAFAQKIDFVLSNPKESAEVAQKGLVTALDKFGSLSQAKRMLGFYQEIV